MSDEDSVMPYTLRRVTTGSEEGAVDSLLDLARGVIREHHPDLDGAEIAYLLRSGKDKGWWGMARRASEESWLLSGGVDLSVQVNGLLWGSHLLTTAGRKFLLDFLLSRFAKKTAGKTHMEVADGEERQIYTVERQDLLGLAALIARHPQGHAELAEVAAIRKAIEQPAQYLLDLQAAEDLEDDKDEEDEDESEGSDGPTPEPVSYYQPRFVDLLGDGPVKVTLRYSGPKKDPAELDGVHVHETQAVSGLPAMVSASSLAYDTSEETVHAYQVWLEDELEDNRRAAVKRSKMAPEPEEPAAREPGEDPVEPISAEVTWPPKHRGKRVAG